MRIPSNRIGNWAVEVFSQCTASKVQRAQRGAVFRNIYLTGSVDGENSAYNETYAFLDNLSSFLYSPVDLRFHIDCYGHSNPLDRAKMRAAESEYHKQFRGSNTDTLLDDATTWSLVKGKTFIKNFWTSEGFKDVLVQPEMMGVLEENLPSLDDQDAFCHTTYLTPDRLYRMLSTNSDRNEIMRKAMKYAVKGKEKDSPEHENTLRQIAVGGIYPYGIGGQSTQRGNVNWLDAPVPQFSAEIVAGLVPIHELWVWDDERGNEKEGLDGEYTTIQFIGEDVVITG